MCQRQPGGPARAVTVAVTYDGALESKQRPLQNRTMSSWSALAAISFAAVFTASCDKAASDTSASAPKPANSSHAQAALPAAPSAPSKETPHQGVTAPIGSGKVRVSAIKAGNFQVWLMDADEKLESVAQSKGRLRLDVPGYPEVELEPHGDLLQGKGPEIALDHPNVTLTVERNGKAETAHMMLHFEAGSVGHHHAEPAADHHEHQHEHAD